MMAFDSTATTEAANGNPTGPRIERLDDRAATALAAHLESLLARLEMLPEQPARAVALDAVEAIVRLYGEGLARMIDQLAQRDRTLISALARDELVSHLLLLHELHPDALDERARRALDAIGPELQAHGRRVELIDVTGDVARVRLARDGHGCASTSRTVRGTIEDAVLRAAPELSRVELEETDAATPALVTLAGPRRSNSPTRASDARSADAHDAVSPRAP